MCKRRCFTYVFTLCVAIALANSSPSLEDNFKRLLGTGFTDQFNINLIKTVLNNPKNAFISPLSVRLCLALLYEGSSGATEKELQNVLGLSKSDIQQQISTVLKYLQDTDILNCRNTQKTKNANYTLNFGTRMYISDKLQPQQPFQSKACDFYQTKIESVNFKKTDAASKIINSWVSDLTNDKITQIVNSEQLSDAVMLITNAIYFKGFWRNKFLRNETHYGGFYVEPDQIQTVSYMSTIDAFYYHDSKELDAKIIKLPYEGNKFSMLIVLPGTKTGLPNLIKRLNNVNLNNQLMLMDKVTVDLSIPKFHFEFEAELSSVLQKMGLNKMFTHEASFPGIARNTDYELLVTEILEKAGIEVNEEGSEAYAATEVQLNNKFGETKVILNVTHPFLFFIMEQQTQSILFAGKVKNPMEPKVELLPSRLGEGTTKPGSALNSNHPANSQTIQNNAFVDSSSSWNQDENIAVAKRFSYFDLELLQELYTTDNVFISPASIKAALAMLLEGAGGKTAEEISKTLRLPLDIYEFREHVKPLLIDLNDKGNSAAIEATNGIFINDNYQVLPSYRNTMERIYHSFVKSVNFANAAQAGEIINKWISEATRGLIPKVVGPENINAGTSLLVTNALYFKGLWLKEFDKESTIERCFTAPNGQCIKVHMMRTSETMNYKFAKDIDADAVEIPYSDEKYAMLLLVPRVRNNIEALMKDLQHASFTNIVDQLEPTEVSLSMPRFSIEYSNDLISTLHKLGIRELFTATANISGIIGNQYLRVDGIVHMSKVEVNEKGTIAAAATGIEVIPLMGSSAPKVVADHPFAFFIYRKDTKNILFEGIINKPTQVEEQRKQARAFQAQGFSYPIEPGKRPQRI